ncbi:HNH endonuclease [Bradyrhizobium canariense]|uniref:WYL domain-containing protein n=1 Tax=Bradyrhizobium canariense TaxID=255045 RepID=UPI000A195108|nr:HNH endonuclease [Bradyrhizobium canariense]OSI22671.1 hypothetical protein BST65_25685 [Bradyrhizobium canariense]OSI28288.1 hypothetical protein BST66_31360 [Bradyrhizobium canariense]OSI47118.1 hypothetical protein BST67_22475 [Bradyrhizobium canariense]OSI49354.1 hypothetical protein BSZ20_07145 [Bradyrhizobium canariense]OSI57125.1 hypothetical protein BSZ15_14775 [Bradyrhizobium canariense]
MTDGVLVDGSVFHKRCLERLKRDAEDFKFREQRLLSELRKPLGFIDNISMIFFRSRQIELLAAKQHLAERIRVARDEHEATLAKIRLIYDLWPTYPPDWDERQRLTNARDHYSCNGCGITGRLHLHHMRALSEGGTNRLENLALLCEKCHSAQHGGRKFKYEDRRINEPSTIEKKIELLNKALSQNKDVRFRYKKPDGSTTTRKVTPGEMRKLTVPGLQSLLGRKIKIEKEGKLCLFGYCHLRKAKRTFAVHRMQRIELC